MNVQYALLIQRAGAGDSLMEIDSNGSEIRYARAPSWRWPTSPACSRLVSSNNEGADLASTLFRGNSDTTLVNGLIVTPNNECIRMNGSGAVPATLKAYSVGLSCNATKYLGTGSYTATDVQTMFASGTNNNTDALTSTLTSIYIDGSNESAIVATDPKTTLSSFFDTTTYVGAVKDAADTWFAGWTCNSVAANFGAGNSGDCTSLPTT